MNNPLEGRRLRYLIGTDNPSFGRDDEATLVSYDVTRPVRKGISIAYCNLFDEKNSGKYGPYVTEPSDTAKGYREGHISAKGVGFLRNLKEQFTRRQAQGFEYVELDNPDGYEIGDVLAAIDYAATFGLKVVAKNPGLFENEDDQLAFVSHPNVVGMIVENGAGLAEEMEELRIAAGKPALPVWFVFWGSAQRARAQNVAKAAQSHPGIFVTHSTAGEYGKALDLD